MHNTSSLNLPYKIIFILFSLFITGCSYKNGAYSRVYHPGAKMVAPDYNNLYYWAAHPWKKDPSDSLIKALANEKRDTLVDVFFIHPTTFTGQRYSWYADVNDTVLNNKTDYSTILYQASVFNQHCRIFCPRYRQAHLSAFYSTTNKDALSAFDTAYADIKRAFEYYLKYYNNNRPVIIAGHSQGALMTERLLKEFFDGRELKKKLVASYIMGWAIPTNTFKDLNVCSSPGETGCFCGWRTFLKGYIPEYIQKEKPVSFVTNPLSWDTTTKFVSRELNYGSVLRDYNKITAKTTNAQIHNGVLWVDRPKFPGAILIRSKNYHIGDINLFYMNMRENIETRIRSFLVNNQGSQNRNSL